MKVASFKSGKILSNTVNGAISIAANCVILNNNESDLPKDIENWIVASSTDFLSVHERFLMSKKNGVDY